jgi:hypothetical protein
MNLVCIKWQVEEDMIANLQKWVGTYPCIPPCCQHATIIASNFGCAHNFAFLYYVPLFPSTLFSPLRFSLHDLFDCSIKIDLTFQNLCVLLFVPNGSIVNQRFFNLKLRLFLWCYVIFPSLEVKEWKFNAMLNLFNNNWTIT